MFIRQSVSIKHVNVPIKEILRYLIKILLCNRAIFIRPDFNMRFNIDIKVILKKWLVQLMCMVRFLCRLDFGFTKSKKWLTEYRRRETLDIFT